MAWTAWIIAGGQALEDVAAGAGDDCFHDLVLFGAGEHEHAGGGGEQRDLLDRVQASSCAYAEVDQHDVRPQVGDQLNRVLIAAGVGQHLDPRFAQRVADPGASQPILVDNDARDPL